MTSASRTGGRWVPHRWLRLPRRWLRLPRRWLRLPRRTVRLRLTIVYGGLFLLSGAALLAITYFLVRQHLPAGPLKEHHSASGASGQIVVQTGVDGCHLTAGPFPSPSSA